MRGKPFGPVVFQENNLLVVCRVGLESRILPRLPDFVRTGFHHPAIGSQGSALLLVSSSPFSQRGMRWFMGWKSFAKNVANVSLSARNAGAGRNIVETHAAGTHVKRVFAGPGKNTHKVPRVKRATSADRSDIERNTPKNRFQAKKTRRIILPPTPLFR